MKKLISLFAIFAVVMSQVIIASAGDFSVKQEAIKFTEEQCDVNVVTPYFEGFKGAEILNRNIRNKVADSVGRANTDTKYMKKLDEEISAKEGKTFVHKIALSTTYDYFKSGDILSLQFNTYYYSGGAHPTNWIDCYTLNTATGELYTLKSLFKENSDYANYLTSHIISVIDKNPGFYFQEYAKTISDKEGNFKFYIEGNKLVIYFDLYDIAPYAAGIKRFSFSAEELKGLLKEEVYNAIKDSKAGSAIRLNGGDSGIDGICLSTQNGIMVPLRAVAGTLGYIVGWSETDGATVAGGSIKEGVNSYSTYGKEPVSIVEPIVQDGITYVPLKYFTSVLEENVSIGSKNYINVSDGSETTGYFTVRIYDKNTHDGTFGKLIVSLEYQQSDVECVKAYAEAVKRRNGAVQYGLFTDKYRDENYVNFSVGNFVTGVSSPWVESYDIAKTGDNLYKITFHATTSAKDKYDYVTEVALEKSGENWRISSVKTNN
jgi:Copper amine oxidase N-terminal domain./Protein of unknown function (DUF3298).